MKFLAALLFISSAWAFVEVDDALSATGCLIVVAASLYLFMGAS